MRKKSLSIRATSCGGLLAASVVLVHSPGGIGKSMLLRALARSARDRGFETFFGPLTFNNVGQAVSYVPPVFQIQNGKTIVIYPDIIKGGELQLGVR